MTLTLQAALLNISTYNQEAPLFAKRISGEFRPDSEAAVLGLSAEEAEQRTDEMAALKCPGLDYFLDVYIVLEMVADFDNSPRPISPDERIAAIIH